MNARGLRLAASVSTLSLLLLACGDQVGPEGAAPGSSPSASGPAGAGTSAQPAVETDHQMEAIGPRTGEVANPDILIVSSTTLSESDIEAIDNVEGVTGTEQFSMAQAVIENEAFTVAAVNPATFRNFTALNVAESQEVWDRIAGGELALREELAKSLPHDSDGYYKLGSTEDAVTIHLGAKTDTVVKVDAVVNQTWAPTLGMVEGNALLVRTGLASPQSLQKTIEKLAGDATVAMVDAIALNGLDPNVRQTAVVTGTVADVVGVFRYTVLGGGRIAPEPSWVSSHIATQQVPILGTITCNKYLFPQLIAALREIQERGLADKIHPGEYAGCYYPRFIAGSTKLSNHSFGLALDLNVPGNLRGSVGEMDRTVVAIFKSWGFGWGGDWGYTDPMHFEMNRLVKPEVGSAGR